MNAIVLDLQKESLNTEVGVSDLLRKALFVAKKLKIIDFEEWIKLELFGYFGKGVPNYREFYGIPMYKDPIHNDYSEYPIENQKIHDSVSLVILKQPIAELEEVYKQSDNKPLISHIMPGIKGIFRKHFQTEIVPEVVFYPPSILKGIFDSIRNITLEWALQLEADGILGENLDFTEEEEIIANEQNKTYQTIIYGASQVQIGEKNIQNINIDINEVKEVLLSIKDSMEQLNLKIENEDELKIELETIESQLKSQNPNPKILTEGLRSVRNILEGVTASFIASGLITHITKIIGF